jgi:Family of unknown function (DUF5678)
MSAIHVKTRIPENRQITLTLPQEVPVGDAELEIVIRESSAAPEFSVIVKDNRPKAFPARPTNPVLAAEHEAFECMLPQLMERFAGRYVAIRDGKVVAVGDSEIDVLTAAHQQCPGKSVYARLVTDQPLLIPRISSPRGARRVE